MRAKTTIKPKSYKKLPDKGKAYKVPPGATLTLEALNGLGELRKDSFVPELKITFNKGKKPLGKIAKTKDTADFIRNNFKRGTIQAQEYFNVLYLDRAYNIIGYYRHTVGTTNSVPIDCKMILGIALKVLAEAIVISHNHPAGSLAPSKADLDVTQKMVKMCKVLDVHLVDHIIVTKEGYYSFLENRLLK